MLTCWHSQALREALACSLCCLLPVAWCLVPGACSLLLSRSLLSCAELVADSSAMTTQRMRRRGTAKRNITKTSPKWTGQPFNILQWRFMFTLYFLLHAQDTSFYIVLLWILNIVWTSLKSSSLFLELVDRFYVRKFICMPYVRPLQGIKRFTSFKYPKWCRCKT